MDHLKKETRGELEELLLQKKIVEAYIIEAAYISTIVHESPNDKKGQ